MAGLDNVNVKSEDLRQLASIIKNTIKEVTEAQEQATSSFTVLANNSELGFLQETQEQYDGIVTVLTEKLEYLNTVCGKLAPIADGVDKISN